MSRARRFALAAALLSVPAAGAQVPEDCFNDAHEEPAAASPVNDLEPVAVPRLPAALQVTDADLAGVLEAIAAHERRRASRGSPGAGANPDTRGGS